MAAKPAWAIERERARRASRGETLWIFGLHAVRAALENPDRDRHRLVLTRNAAERLGLDLAELSPAPEISDPRRFAAPLEPDAVHQGAALETSPLVWPSVSEVTAPGDGCPTVVLLDRVSDPHNVGAILRSAEVFGARAVIAPRRHSAPETGALAKAASGALERMPYLRVPNLSRAIEALRASGYFFLGLDGASELNIATGVDFGAARPLAIVLGSEGAGLRHLTTRLCDRMASIPSAGPFGSLNVSNAAAVALYAASTRKPDQT